MGELIYFLVIFNRITGELISNETFVSSEIAADELFKAEQFYDGSETIEVVLLGSDSIETLKKTHGHYFSGKRVNTDYSELLGA